MIYRRIYNYVYVRHGQGRWIRVSDEKIQEFTVKHKNIDIYATIQRYKSKIEEDEENQYCPIYFDFDAPKGKTTSETIEEVKKDALKVAQFFLQLGVPKPLVRMWFSGRRGFHVVVSPEIFGIEPHRELTKIVKQCALSLMYHLDLKYLDYKSIYSIKRMWRIPNSIHKTSGLHKYELYYEELLKKSADEIISLAKNPREKPLWDEVEYETITPELNNWWQQFYTEYDSLKELENLKPRKILSIPKGEFPICIADLMKNSVKGEGLRNRTVVVLAGFYKDCGYSEQETTAILVDFSKKIPDTISKSRENERVLNAKAVVKSVYGDKNYHFSCAFVRSLGVPKNPISCDGDMCKYVKPEDQEPIEPIDVDLAETTKSSLVGMPLKTKCMVSGKMDEPYYAPREIKITCSPSSKKEHCIGCKLAAHKGNFTFSIDSSEKVLLELIDVRTSELNAFIKSYVKLPRQCHSFNVEVIKYYNLTDLTLIPRVRLSSENIMKKNEYVVKRGFYVGHDIESSEEYEFICYPYPDPKTQQSVLLMPKKDKLEKTDLNLGIDPNELLKLLAIFKQGDLTIDEKMTDKQEDLEANVTKIYDRHDFGKAVDLVFHSPIAFYFNEEFIQKGWLELMVIGDSGQGKTQLVKNLMSHYQLGMHVSGETAGRTGLTYSIQQIGKKWFILWGVIPLNDMRLVVIDEFHELKEEDVQQLTLTRDGVTSVQRVVMASKNSRTRLIFLANPKENTLSDETYKVNALQKLLKHKEDLRRLDFAIMLERGTVSLDKLSQLIDSKKVPHKYTSYLCNLLIRWIWSLSPNNIKFTDEATKYILDSVKSFSNRFSSKVQLTEIGDLRKKLARMSVAMAGLIFNSNDGTNLLVEKKHAEAAIEFLTRIYQDMDYEKYTQEINKRNLTSEKEALAKEKLKVLFNNIDEDVRVMVVENVINYTLSHRRIIRSGLKMLFRNNDTRCDDYLATLYNCKLIHYETGRRNLLKTPLCIKLLQELLNEMSPQENLPLDIKESNGDPF